MSKKRKEIKRKRKKKRDRKIRKIILESYQEKQDRGIIDTELRRRFGVDKKGLVSFRNQRVKPHRLITVSHG